MVQEVVHQYTLPPVVYEFQLVQITNRCLELSRLIFQFSHYSRNVLSGCNLFFLMSETVENLSIYLFALTLWFL